MQKKFKPELIYSIQIVSIFTFLSLIGILLYFKMFSNPFINFDDYKFLNFYPAIVNGQILEIFKTVTIGHYYPISNLTMAFDLQICTDGSAICSRFTNLSFHILNAVLLYLLFLRIFAFNKKTSFFGSLFFLVNGMNSEPVLWFAARNHLVSTFFLMSTLFYFLRSRQDKDKKLNSPLVFILYIFSILSKSLTSLSLLMMIGWDALHGDLKKSARVKIWMFLFCVIALTFTYYQSTERTLLINFGEGMTLMDRLLLLSQELCWYLRQFLFPIHQSVFYDFYAFKTEWYDYLCFLTIIIFSLFYLQKNKTLFLFGWIWFFIFLLPVSKFISFGDDSIVADRYMYTAGIGFIIVGATFWSVSSQKIKVILFPFIFCSLFWNAFSAWQRSYVWQDSNTLWQDVINNEPQSGTAWLNLGLKQLEDNNLQAAEVSFLEHLKLKPNWPNGYFNLGLVYSKTGRDEQALHLYQIGKNKFPQYDFIYVILYDQLIKMGLKNEALQVITDAVKLFPNNQQLIQRKESHL